MNALLFDSMIPLSFLFFQDNKKEERNLSVTAILLHPPQGRKEPTSPSLSLSLSLSLSQSMLLFPRKKSKGKDDADFDSGTLADVVDHLVLRCLDDPDGYKEAELFLSAYHDVILPAKLFFSFRDRYSGYSEEGKVRGARFIHLWLSKYPRYWGGRERESRRER